MNPHDKPLAAPGLKSYRYRYGPHGCNYVMIGANSPGEALTEAMRSLKTDVHMSNLQVFDGINYIDAMDVIAADSRPGPYYVSAIDGPRTYCMAGPYEKHADALLAVDSVKLIAINNDPSGRAWFMSWGTVRIEGSDRIGMLNKMGLV